jgi:M6 family metalloprotease-like protein
MKLLAIAFTVLATALAAQAAEPRHFKLAVIPVEFADQAHDARFQAADFDALLFSKDSYKKSPSGEACFGSVADWYRENSSGRFELEGKIFDWVKIGSKRKTFEREDTIGKGVGFALFLVRALHTFEAREGKDALDAYDAVSFVISGGAGPHMSVLWPHAAGIPWHGRLLRYYLMHEKNGDKFASIGIHCHEMGHVLGILDKYGEQDKANPKAHAGLGVWCTMAVGHRGDPVNGDRRPLHLCAWCKTELGWAEPRVVDPCVPQTVRLHGIEGHPAEVVKVLIDPDGSEYFLLENRRRTGFDAGIARPGLLIWHVGEFAQRFRNRVSPYNIDLEEAHGDETRDGPFKDLARIPWPQPGKTEFTPWTSPGSTSWNLSALPVYLTDIHEEGDDIVLTVAPPHAAAQSQPPPIPRPSAPPVGSSW